MQRPENEPSSLDSSYQHISHSRTDSEVDTLPSTSTSTTSSSESDAHNDAEREWHESLQQLELILTMVLIPYVGKYFGRKAAYWGLLSSW